MEIAPNELNYALHWLFKKINKLPDTFYPNKKGMNKLKNYPALFIDYSCRS
jgi:hypothetical protein